MQKKIVSKINRQNIPILKYNAAELYVLANQDTITHVFFAISHDYLFIKCGNRPTMTTTFILLGIAPAHFIVIFVEKNLIKE